MKRFWVIFIAMGFLVTLPLSAEEYLLAANKRRAVTKKRVSGGSTSSATSSATSSGGQGDLREALSLVKAGQNAEAAARLFQLSVSPRYAEQRMQLRYLLGLTLYQLKMYQLSAFQFISVIKDGKSKYVTPSLEKLSLAADELGDDTLLNYAISRVKSESFPAVHRDMLYYRIGEFQIGNEQYGEAVQSLSQVAQDSAFGDKAGYLKGVAYAHAGDVDNAISTFEALIQAKESAPVADPTRVAALMGKARALYQKKDWGASIEAYRAVPRDSEFWHDTLFEASWAMMRSGLFRSAISNFQSLHSPYYEENYLPESLLLRSIVYLYICQYDEMDKVLNLFKKIYVPVYKDSLNYLKTQKNAVQYFNDVILAMQAAEKDGFDPAKSKFPIPYVIVRKVAKEGDFQRSFKYIKALLDEKKRVGNFESTWRGTGLAKYATRTLERRVQRARAKAGRQIRTHMLAARVELLDLFEQEGFIRYEMNNGKREKLKRMSAGKVLPKVQIDEDNDRDFYIQNGYQYWPFRGEYWLDELGNYHYVGTQSCD